MSRKTKISKPTHFSKKETIKHLNLTPREFRALVIYSGLYVKMPSHRRYKGRRTLAYYTREDVKYLRTSVYYVYLLELRSHASRVKRYASIGAEASLKSLQNRLPSCPAKEMMENRYKDFLAVLKDLGEVLSSFYFFHLNRASITSYLQDTLSAYDTKKAQAISKPELGSLLSLMGDQSRAKESEKICENLQEAILSFGWLDFVFCAESCFFVQLNILSTPLVFRVPFGSALEFLSPGADHSNSPGGKENSEKRLKKEFGDLYKVDLSLFEDFGSFSCEFLALFLGYCKENRDGILGDSANHKGISKVQGGKKLCVDLERVGSSVFDLVGRCLGFEITSRADADVVIVDRGEKSSPEHRKEVHFQWLLDSFNSRVLLDKESYRKGAEKLPMHKNPFGEKKKGPQIGRKELLLRKCIMTSKEEEVYEKLVHLGK